MLQTGIECALVFWLKLRGRVKHQGAARGNVTLSVMGNIFEPQCGQGRKGWTNSRKWIEHILNMNMNIGVISV